MVRDTQEWLRPWGAEPPVDAAPDAGVGPAGDAAPDAGDAAPDAGDPAPAVQSWVRSGPVTPGSTVRIVTSTPPPSSAPATPPEGWSSRDDGPGSPEGSVRPPDTSGTVEPPAPRRERSLVRVAVAALFGAVLGTGATLALVDGGGAPESAPPPAGETDPVRAPTVVAEGTETAPAGVVPAVAEAVLPSVVRIDVQAERGGEDGDAVLQPVGLGSGVVYTANGYVLTNNHVVEDADALEVVLSDGERLTAEVVGRDRLTDLAVVKVDRTGLPAINLRSSSDLVVGETAVAIGSPFGFDASVTAGIVSSSNRDLEVPPSDGQPGFVIPSVIQTDAAINPGNSGGALVDARGELIGINTAILSTTGGSQGVGFAIPTRAVVAAAEQLIADGEVSHPFLGISGEPVTAVVEDSYAEEHDYELDGGAVVVEVVEGSGADEGGLRPGDVIVAVEGNPIPTMSDLTVEILQLEVGDTITIDVVRDGQERALRVTLGERTE